MGVWFSRCWDSDARWHVELPPLSQELDEFSIGWESFEGVGSDVSERGFGEGLWWKFVGEEGCERCGFEGELGLIWVNLGEHPKGI